VTTELVWGDGPKPAPIAFFGETPGKHEMEEGIPFVPWAPAGQLFAHLLKGIKLSRSCVFISNIYKTRIGNDKAPTEEQIALHQPYLECELADVQPKIIVPLGASATRVFLGKVNLEAVHGIPHQGANGTIIVPCFHPAASLYSPKVGALIAYDFEQLSGVLRGEIPPVAPKDQYPTPEYRRLDSAPLVGDIIHKSTVVGVDTEGYRDDPWSVQCSGAPGEAFLVRSSSIEALGKLAEELPKKKVILHNALHDWDILDALGITLRDFTCTQIMAHLLCLEPLSLKPLSYRHSGMHMVPYSQVVAQAKQDKYLTYLEKLNDHEWPPVEPHLVWDKGEPHLKKPRSLNSRIQTILKNIADGKEVDAQARWAKVQKDMPEEIMEMVEVIGGPEPRISLSDIPRETSTNYGCKDADATLRNFWILDRKIKALGLQEVLDMDLNLVPMTVRMMQIGIKADKRYFERFGRELSHEIAEIDEKVIKEVGIPGLNLDSPDQVAELFFHKLGLKPLKMTRSKKRGAVDDATLEALTGQHPVVQLIKDRRERATLRKTYTNKLPDLIREDGRIHTKLTLTGQPAGRYTSSNPNLLAQPTRTSLGRRIRYGYIAGEGCNLGAWDLDQIEMRITAHESEDEALTAIFMDSDRHFHKETCHKIYGTPINQIDKGSTEYKMSKNISFGILYGISAYGLKLQLEQRGQKVSRSDCQKWIEEWFSIYPGVFSYMEWKKAEARNKGYVSDMWGRIRYFPGVHSPISNVREEALRQVMNHPIQSGAQGVIKAAQAVIWRDILPYLWRDGIYCECVLQIHDELLFEFEQGLERLMDPVINSVMATAVELKVPVASSGNWGKNWGALK
jgi:uracil-DNA glycosylase family 4